MRYINKSKEVKRNIILVYLKFGQKISLNQESKDSFLISFGDFTWDILPIFIPLFVFCISLFNLISK